MEAWVEVIALGGTIASTPRRDGQGVEPGLTAEDLIAAVPGLADLAPIRARTLARVGHLPGPLERFGPAGCVNDSILTVLGAIWIPYGFHTLSIPSESP